MLTVKKLSLCGCLLSLVLTGCSSSPAQPEVAAPAAEPEPQLTEAQKRDRQIARLLAGAERALARDRLLMPGYDNAYDRYASVLMLDPDNREAKLGLQAIVLRYLDMARDAAQHSHFDEAQTYLDRAARILPGDDAVQLLIQQQRDALAKPAPRPVAQNAHYLDARALARRGAEIQQQLAQLAQTAKQDNYMVLIVAASDAEGRWIYQTMRKAVPGFLLRGDIQVGAPTRVELLPPL